ncbi:MAG TPA: prolyl oligopeptidase family serine peptidase [Verrucomicrobiae bacterium]|nr:prolyl oligopeptidase family serine peptidase [Verrucomicrobiae bacterium]
MPRLLLALLLLLPANVLAARPDPSGRGRYAVGRTRITFTRTSTTGQARPLETVIWYPAVPGTGTLESNIDVLRDAAVLKRRWPLVMFSHGACGFPEQSPFLTEGLASWGFVVAAPPHPGSTIQDYPSCFTPATFPDSAVNRVADIRFVVDQMLALAKEPGSPFAGRINRRRIGVSGHSFGGYTTLRVLAEDDRFRAGVALAPAVIAAVGLGLTSHVHQPTIVLVGDHDSLAPLATAGRAAFALLDGPRFLVELLNSGHCAFAVGCIAAACGTGCEPTALPLPEAHRLTLRYAVPFFLRYVRGQDLFPAALRPNRAPGGVVVLEAHAGG